MNLTPTAEQELIINTATQTEVNILVNARAGAAKTSTIEMIAAALPTTRILCLAFNKKIAVELQARLPSNSEAATLNSVGHRAWRDYIGRSPNVFAGKCYQLLKEVIEEQAPADREPLWENFRAILDAVSTSKSEGYLPFKVHPSAKPLIMDESFFDLITLEANPLERQVINEIIVRSFRAAIKGSIDFDDQILCPTIMPASFPAFPLTMIDEAQDLSAINHAMLFKIVKKKRLIAVGDPCQAIYGFRGASDNSMREMQQRFDMKELYLTICFRSAKGIIEAARWRAPDMQWRPDAPEGVVQTYAEWGPPMLEDGDAIICRNNAPLFSMAIALLRAKLLPELSSGDIIKGLLATMKKFGPASMEQDNALVELARWEQAAKEKSKNKAHIQDQAACIRLFLEETDTLGAGMTFLQDIANRSGRIKLMTGHKSKGLEFDRVWFLDEKLLRKEGQDRNLKYVIQTRARESLFMVESDGWQHDMADIPPLPT